MNVYYLVILQPKGWIATVHTIYAIQ